MGENLHALLYRMHACSLQSTGTLYLDDAHTAAAHLVDILEEAEGGDIDAYLLSCFQYSVVFRHIQLYAVYGYMYFVHI